MRFTLRSLVLASAILAAAALTTKVASAEVLHVPFSFTVNGTALPAGHYAVQFDDEMHVVTLRSEDNKHIFGWVAGPGPDSTRGAIMRFDQSPSGYTLRDVQYHSMVTSRLDKKGKSSDDSAIHVIHGE